MLSVHISFTQLTGCVPVSYNFGIHYIKQLHFFNFIIHIQSRSFHCLPVAKTATDRRKDHSLTAQDARTPEGAPALWQQLSIKSVLAHATPSTRLSEVVQDAGLHVSVCGHHIGIYRDICSATVQLPRLSFRLQST